MQATDSGRLRSIDALRGVAAIAVVLYHFTWGFDHLGPPHVPPLRFGAAVYGHLGVDLFFVISGFVILRTLERTTGLADFAVSRFARLYPAYLVAMAVTLVVEFGMGINPRHLGLGDVMASAFMASDAFGRRYVDPSYWTLGFEVVFYALAGITYLGFGVRRVELACLAWLAVGIPTIVAHHYRVRTLVEGEWSYLFVLGMMVHRLGQGQRSWLTWGTVAAALGMAAFVGGQPPSNLSTPATVAVAAAFALAVWGAAAGRLRLDVLPLLFLGDISYSLYLVHQVPGLAMLRWLEGSGVASGAAVPLTIVVVVLVASCMRYGVERPAQAWIKLRWRGGSVLPRRRAGEGGTEDLRLR